MLASVRAFDSNIGGFEQPSAPIANTMKVIAADTRNVLRYKF
jgi:hypothetical protein